MDKELNNTTTCPICQPCCPNVKIDKIEEGMTGKEVADLLYNNFDKLNKSKANKCVERKVRHLLKGENKIFNRTAKNKFVQEVFYVWSKKDVNKQLEDFKETTDLLHDHLVDYTNPHQVTKDQVGLGNVDNTSDEDKPISTATQEALNNLTDKIDDVKSEIDDYTVNGYKISNNPVLDGEDIKLDNYSKVTTDTEIQSTDSATMAFGKLEYKLDKEIQDRIEAIDSEENQRKAADEALQNSINIVSTNLAEEIETRVENDNRHQQEIENLQTDLNTEKAVRASEDEVLSDRIYKEVQDRQNAVAAIYDNLEQEAATRLAADEQLQRNIDEEIANRTESDTNIQNNLNTHINDKTNPHEVTKAQVGLGNVTDDAQVKRSEMGAANGVAQLDSSGLVPSSQLPSYVDDVLEYDTLTAFPATGETGKIYVTKDTNLTYRWSGTQYTEISKSLALGETSSTAYAGDKGKANREAIESLPDEIVTGFGTAARSATQWSIPTTKTTKSGLNYSSEVAGTTITVPSATSTQAGLMTATDKAKLDGIEENANNYTHPDEPGWKHIPAGGTTGQVLMNGGNGVAVWENLNIEDLLSYGVEWDVTVADPALTRIGNPLLHKSLPIQSAYKGCIANGNVINYYLDPNDWSKKADGTNSVLDGTDGTVRVHIPKFYGKSGSNGNKRWVRISTTKIDNTWEEIPEMLVDAYRCTVDTTESATPKAVSVVNTTAQFRGGGNRTANDTYLSTDKFRSDLGKPITGVNRATMRTYAQNAGSQLLSYSYYKWIFYWAWVIEYATFNSQATYNEELTAEGYHQGGLGAGVTNWQNTATSWSGYNGAYPLTPCGYCNEFGNFTGIKDLVIPETVNGSNTIATHTFHVPRWRGFDNPFGDIWTNLDGILIDTPVGVENPVPTAYVVKDSSKFTDNLDTIKSNKDAVFTLCSNKGYTKSWILGETAEMMPETIGGSTTTYMCDYYWVEYDDTPGTLRVGGTANDGGGAGLGRFHANVDVSYSYAAVGFRTLTLM